MLQKTSPRVRGSLPPEVADGACERVYERITPPNVAALVRRSPTAPWHAKPTKVIELRNEVEENGASYAENATLKALAAYRSGRKECAGERRGASDDGGPAASRTD